MAEANKDAWQLAILLDRYYEKVGKAAAGMGSCPKFVEFRAGYAPDLMDNTAVPPSLLPIPRDMVDIPNEFYRAEVVASYSNGVTLCKCEIPQSGVSAPVQHNIIGLFDQDGDLVAVALTLPDWVTPSEVYRAYPAITFPIQKNEENRDGN